MIGLAPNVLGATLVRPEFIIELTSATRWFVI